LQPADATHPGLLVASGPQTLGGTMTFSNEIITPEINLSSLDSVIRHDTHLLYHTGGDPTRRNLYLGYDAGPLGVTGTEEENTVVGVNAGNGITTANECTFIGTSAGANHQDGNHSTYVGYSAGSSGLDTEQSVFIGHQAGANVEHGSNLIAIGKDAGIDFAGFDAQSIAIGNPGGGSNSIWLGNSGFTACRIYGINGQTVQGGALPVVVDADNQLGTIISSRKYKRDISEVNGSDVLKLRAKKFKMINGDGQWRYGFIAEEVEPIFPEAIVYEELRDNGKVILNEQKRAILTQDPKAVQYDQLWPLLQDVVRVHEARISELEHVISELKK